MQAGVIKGQVEANLIGNVVNNYLLMIEILIFSLDSDKNV